MAIRASQRAKLYERAQRQCEIVIPGICLRYANNAHHRKNQGQGGDDRLSNLLLACGSGTTGCHGWVTEHPGISKREKGWSIWRSDFALDVPVLYRGQWARLSDDGHVYLLHEGDVRIELGHLSIVGRPDARH